MALTQVLFYLMSESSLTSCPHTADVYFMSYLIPPLHLIRLTTYVLLDFYQGLSHFPSFASILTSLFSVVHTDLPFCALLFCLDVWTCIPNLLHSPRSASVLLSGSFLWFALAIFLVLLHFVLEKVIFLQFCTLHSMEWLLLSNQGIQQPHITVTE